MSVKMITGYSMYCNGCEKEFDAGDGFTLFLSMDQLIEVVTDSEWTTDGEIWHCPDCPTLAMCECCGAPAGTLAGERDYNCEACWDSMEPDPLQDPLDKDGVCTLKHERETIVLGTVYEKNGTGVYFSTVIRESTVRACCEQGHPNMTAAMTHGKILRDESVVP